MTLRKILAAAIACGTASCSEGTADLDPDAGGGGDAQVSVEPPDGGTMAEPGATRYLSGRTQSPITPFVAEHLRAIAGSGNADSAFLAKVGDSITVSNQFLHCFANNPDSISADIDTTVAHYAGFDRSSLAAGVGWSAGRVLSGSPSPLEQELNATSPGVAIVMYGSNDAESGNLDAYGANLLTIVDALIDDGVVPIISTIPPRDYNANDVRVPFYNLMARAAAESRQVPLIDLHRELLPLGDYGLSGDGLHPRSIGGGCDFSAAGMEAGYNVRNRVTIEAIDRVRRVLDGSAEFFDEEGVAWRGQGTRAEPFEVPLSALPFTHLADTAQSEERHHSSYSCGEADEGGSEVWYRFSASQSQALRITVADRGDVDVDVHILSGSTEASACVDRNDRTLDLIVPAGEHYLVVDTFVSNGVEKAGEYLLTIAQP